MEKAKAALRRTDLQRICLRKFPEEKRITYKVKCGANESNCWPTWLIPLFWRAVGSRSFLCFSQIAVKMRCWMRY